MARVKINLGQGPVDADRMEFKALDEPWAQYRLEDGTVVKLKLVVSDVYKLQQSDALTGLPQLVVKSTNIMSVEPARKKEELN